MKSEFLPQSQTNPYEELTMRHRCLRGDLEKLDICKGSMMAISESKREDAVEDNPKSFLIYIGGRALIPHPFVIKHALS